MGRALDMDARDSLAPYRAQFYLPESNGEPQSYFCGHSLGLQPRRARQYALEELQEWEKLGVEGHFRGARPWLSYHERLTPHLAQLTGAHASEVVAMNSLTVNLHLMLASFYRPTAQRHKILIERGAFPSDRYAATSQLRWHGVDAGNVIEIGPRDGESCLRFDDIAAVLELEGSNIATVLLPGVQYLTGQRFDMQNIAALARQQGCIVGFDLAHAIGNVPLALHDWNVDFAVWCGYKYLNGGPGAIGGAFVHQRHHRDASLPRLTGWWGHDSHSRFAMPDTYVPMPGAEAWQLSNPPILATAPLLASLELFTQAGLTALRGKSIALTAYLEQLLHARASNRITILTPADQAARGAQLSLRLNVERARAKDIHRQLTARGFVCDWREPDIVRVAPAPFYNTYKEVWLLVDTLLGIMN